VRFRWPRKIVTRYGLKQAAAASIQSREAHRLSDSQLGRAERRGKTDPNIALADVDDTEQDTTRLYGSK
jgi:hypothetical protein